MTYITYGKVNFLKCIKKLIKHFLRPVNGKGTQS